VNKLAQLVARFSRVFSALDTVPLEPLMPFQVCLLPRAPSLIKLYGTLSLCLSRLSPELTSDLFPQRLFVLFASGLFTFSHLG
jgi:hypothetical protein